MGAIQNLKVAILGAGSIGCYLGGHLMKAGCDVTLIGRQRSKWNFDMKGLELTHYKRRPILFPRGSVNYAADYGALRNADVVLVCVKSQDSETAAQNIADNASPESLCVSFQNGVNNQVTIQSLSARQTLGAIVPFNVTQAGRGIYHCGTEGDLIIEADSDKRLKTLIKAFRKSGMGAKSVVDIQSYQWGKLLVNLNNALSALSGDTLRAGLSQKSYRKVLAAMLEEGLAICQGAGLTPKNFGKTSTKKTISVLRLPNALFTPVMNSILKIDETARSSMLDDLEAGKKSEVEYLQGAIVGLAQQTGQYAPINTIILNEVRKAFRLHQSPQYSGEDMLALIEGT